MIYIAPKRKGFNKYKIYGDVAILYLEKITGEVFETFVDVECLEKLIKHNHSWHTIYDKKLKSYYAKCSQSYHDESGKYRQKTIYLHRFVLDYNGKDYVDHENHDTLDNQLHNLKIVDQSVNMKNGSDIRKNNSSGEPNVGWSNGDERWIVQFSINKKNKTFGRFRINELDKAIEFAKEMRQKLYKPDFMQEGYNIDNLKFIS